MTFPNEKVTMELVEELRKIRSYAYSHGYTGMEMDEVWRLAHFAICNFEKARQEYTREADELLNEVK